MNREQPNRMNPTDRRRPQRIRETDVRAERQPRRPARSINEETRNRPSEYRRNPREQPRESRYNAYGNPKRQGNPNRPYSEPPRQMRYAGPAQGHPQRVHQEEKAPPSAGKKILVAAFNLLFYVVTIGIIATGVLFTFSGKNDASIMGYRFYRVLTASMKPQKDSPPGGFDQGAVAIVKIMEGKDTQEGDIVTYALGDKGNYLTHRLVERIGEMEGREGNYVITKGDANESRDPPVDEEQIVGKVVFAIPKIGTLIEVVQEQFWACLVCVLSLFGFFIVLKAYLLSDATEGKSNQRMQQNYY